MAKNEITTEGYGSYNEFRVAISDDLRGLPNTWFLLFDAHHLPEFLVCLNGSFVGIKIKTLVDTKEAQDIEDEIRDSAGLVFAVTRGSWPSTLKTLEALCEKTNGSRN